MLKQKGLDFFQPFFIFCLALNRHSYCKLFPLTKKNQLVIKKGDKMIQAISKKKTQSWVKLLLIVNLISTLVSTTAFSEPSEIKTQKLVRTTESGVSLNTQLSKNTYKQEEYQASYTVEVPYQVEETYTEQVPYTVEVPYTDYETDYRNEYRCENVTRYREEYRCHDVTRYRERCETKQECYLVPGKPGQCREVEECGTNAHGQRICKTRRVCDSDSEPQRQCQNRQVCEREPYTDRECRNESVPYTEQECKNVSVPYQKPVTKYRTETRYNKVTKTRTVTKYRTEDRCCRTETRTVFDKQLQFNVELRFPENSILSNQEKDNIQVKLKQVNPVSFEIENLNSVHHYKIANTKITGSNVVIDLALQPHLNLTNAGIQSIGLTKLDVNKHTELLDVVLKDLIQNPKVSTSVQIDLIDQSNQSLIESLTPTKADGLYSAQSTYKIQKNMKIDVIVKVIRTGIVVDNQSIQFDVIRKIDRTELTEENLLKLKDKNQIILSSETTSPAISITVNDLTTISEHVQSKYVLMLGVQHSSFKNGQKVVLIKDKILSKLGTYQITDLLSAQDIKTYMKKGYNFGFQVVVERSVKVNDANQTIKITQQNVNVIK